MMIRRSLLLLSFLAVLSTLVFTTGCASTSSDGMQRIEPGQTVEIEGRGYKLMQVEEEFVLMAYRAPGAENGMITGYVDEVLRISRHDLGTGRWYSNEKLPGLYLQWLGFDSFGLAHDRKVVGDAEVVMVK